MKGTFEAIIREAAFGTADTGTPQFAMLCEITSGEHTGKARTWYGPLTEKAVENTFKGMVNAGWDGLSLDTADTQVVGSKVQIVIDEEEQTDAYGNIKYDPDTGEPLIRERVQWVNKPVSLALKNRMDVDGKRDLAARFSHALPGRAAPRNTRSPERRSPPPRERQPGDDDEPMPGDNDYPGKPTR